jgi:hypothetical protein
VIDEPVCIDPGDGRQVTAVQWIEVSSPAPSSHDDLTYQGTLFWTKPGSAHFHSNGVTKSVRLGQVGNWAGCNALGVCVGMSQSLIREHI